MPDQHDAPPPLEMPQPDGRSAFGRSLTRSLSFIGVNNFSDYELPKLQFSRLSTDLRDSNIDYFDSASDDSAGSDLNSDQENEKEGFKSLRNDEEDNWDPPLPVRRQSSRLRWQAVPPRKPLPLDCKPAHLPSRKSLKRAHSSLDPNLVTWDGKDDPRNPLNWSKKNKWVATVLVSSFTFISPVASTMVAPALPDIAEEFEITSKVEDVLIMSIFLLAYAVGPFVLGPLSEMYGRVVVLQAANMVYLIFNTACGFAQNKQQMLAFRFLSGLGGSAPQAIGGGVLSDCWAKDERGRAIALYSLAPFLGPAVGPIAGGYITLHTTWRWIFWSTSIADTFIQILAFLFLRETYHPAILAKICERMTSQTGNTKLHTRWQQPDRTFGQIFRKAMCRPFLMLTTQPALQAMAVYRAYGYGIMYLMFSTLPQVFRDQYGQDIGTASLHYISLGIGFVVGLQISGPMQDKTYRYLKLRGIDPCTPLRHAFYAALAQYSTVPKIIEDPEQANIDRQDTEASKQLSNRASDAAFGTPRRVYTTHSDPTTGIPEHRLPLCLPFGLLIPIGSLIYGLSAAANTHWIIPDIGTAIFCVGLIVTFNCAQAYVVDTYTNEKEGINYAASATGAAAFVRTMAGFSFPLFGPGLFKELGVGGGNALLAGVALVVGLVAPYVLWRYGVVLRRLGHGRL
jgi:multidrug resistance protein